jgi:hypothetical protein
MRKSPDSSDSVLSINSGKLDNINMAISKGGVVSSISNIAKSESEVLAQDIQEGYNIGGGTTTPATLTATAEGKFKAIIIQWNAQNNLTNLDYYELQVSDDNVTWYSLEEDGTDWKDTLGNTTKKYSITRFVHYFPFGGTSADPEGVQLYYRIRQTTKAPTSSDWTTVTATSSVIDTGDIAVNSITANKIATTFLDTAYANVNYQMTIGFNSKSGSSTYDSPAFGDTRLYLDGDQISYDVYMYDNTGTLGWFSTMKLGGRNSENSVVNMLKANGIYNSDELIFDDDLIPTKETLLYQLNDNYYEAHSNHRSCSQAGSTPSFESVTWNANLPKSLKLVLTTGAFIQIVNPSKGLMTDFWSTCCYCKVSTDTEDFRIWANMSGSQSVIININELDITYTCVIDGNTVSDTGTLPDYGWHFFWMHHDSVNGKIVCGYDSVVDVILDISAYSWDTSSGNAVWGVINTETLGSAMNISDWLFSTKLISILELQEHYSSGAIWNSARGKKDLALLSSGASMLNSAISDFEIELNTWYSPDRLYIYNLQIMVDNQFYTFPTEYYINPTIAASTWYGLWVSPEGKIMLATASWTGISGNQLNIYDALYDRERGYCYDSTNGRLIAVMKSNSGGTGYDYMIPIYNIPYSYIYANNDSGAADQTLTSNVPSTIIYDNILVDINTEWNATTGVYTSKINQYVYMAATIFGCSDNTSYRRRYNLNNNGILTSYEDTIAYTSLRRYQSSNNRHMVGTVGNMSVIFSANCTITRSPNARITILGSKI